MQYLTIDRSQPRAPFVECRVSRALLIESLVTHAPAEGTQAVELYDGQGDEGGWGVEAESEAGEESELVVGGLHARVT